MSQCWTYWRGKNPWSRLRFSRRPITSWLPSRFTTQKSTIGTSIMTPWWTYATACWSHCLLQVTSLHWKKSLTNYSSCHGLSKKKPGCILFPSSPLDCLLQIPRGREESTLRFGSIWRNNTNAINQGIRVWKKKRNWNLACRVFWASDFRTAKDGWWPQTDYEVPGEFSFNDLLFKAFVASSNMWSHAWDDAKIWAVWSVVHRI